MTVFDIRYQNYELLFARFKTSIWSEWPDEKEHGMMKRFAEKLGISQAYCSHINTKYKPIGDKMARKFEARLGLPDGWMDHVHDEQTIRTPEEEAFISAAVELYRADPKEAQNAILRAFAEKMREKTK